MKLVYRNEPILFSIALAISVVAWAAILYGTHGLILIAVPFAFLAYVFTHSGFVAHFKGRGALLSPDQFPDLDDRLKAAARTLGMETVPQTYLVNGNGVFNAFATKFLHRYYVILNSSVVDALRDDPDAISFYIGHELGHIRRKHLLWHMVLAPGLMLPLLGAGYSRAREYTCDLHGATCCINPASAVRALAVLAVGSHRWKDMNIGCYIVQANDTAGFWMSFHELVASYPWLTKRLMHVSDFSGKRPARNPLAFVLAAFVPRISLATIVLAYLLSLFYIPQLLKDIPGMPLKATHAATHQPKPALDDRDQ